MDEGREPKISHPKKRAFLAAYSKVGIIMRAAEMAEIDRRTHTQWLHDDPDYAEAFGVAKESACEVLEAEMRRRAVEGVEEPVFQNGRQVGVVQKYSDVLLIFALKGAMPEKYRDRHEVKHTADATLAEVLGAARKHVEQERARFEVPQ